MPVRCDCCRFFHPNPPAHAPDEISMTEEYTLGGGSCRRNPPIRQELQLSCFPIVAGNWWCGEFEARRDTEDAPRTP